MDGAYEMTGEEEQIFRKEFHQTAEELNKMHQIEPKPHPGIGVKEMFFIADKHPSLESFFEEGDTVLKLSDADREEFERLSQRYLDGLLAPSEQMILEAYYLRYQREKKHLDL